MLERSPTSLQNHQLKVFWSHGIHPPSTRQDIELLTRFCQCLHNYFLITTTFSLAGYSFPVFPWPFLLTKAMFWCKQTISLFKHNESGWESSVCAPPRTQIVQEMAEQHGNKEIKLKRAHSSHTEGEGLALRHRKPEMTHFVIPHFADSMGDMGIHFSFPVEW